MQHSRQEVIQRTLREFELLDHLVANLSEKGWLQPAPRPEGKDSWTVKDAVAHITHFKADVVRAMHRIPKPTAVRGLGESAENHVIYLRWRDRSPQEVLTWHRQVQEEVLVALQEAPEAWFSGRERRAEWPFDLDGHSAYHRIKDIEEAMKQPEEEAPAPAGRAALSLVGDHAFRGGASGDHERVKSVSGGISPIR